MAGGYKVYRKLDAIQGRAPRLHVGFFERAETDEEIRSAVRYCGNDNYLAVAFGVDEARIARIRATVTPRRRVIHAHGAGVDCGRIGPEVDDGFRRAVTAASGNLHKRIIKLYERRARKDRLTLEQAAYSMGMRP